ncbi:hypothetical protein [Sporomusa aerivorans]|uniref:hypothetical protein n=1 Tax=Sporomusa aerivorans TaxID=204936 RepID=UPI00352BAB94
MKKKTIIALCAVFSLSMAGTALTAPANLFAVVPEKHWTYSALSQLADAGLVEGFGGGAYKENVILTRCEMAAIVAKAMAKSANADATAQATLAKLKEEFAPEFSLSETGNEASNVGKRLDKLEKNVSPVKITSGDVRIRYQTNWDQKAKSSDTAAGTRLQERVRVNIAADVTENVKFNSRITATHTSNKRTVNGTSKTSAYVSPAFERAELQWTNKQTNVVLGRILPSLGQGIIWDGNSIDGAYATYDFGNSQLSAGYGDLAAYTGSAATINASLANLNVKVGLNTNLTVAHLDTMTNSAGYNFNQTAYGFKTQTGDVTVTGEYVENNDGKLPANAQKHGYWGRVQWKGIDNSKPGTFGVNFDYLSLGNYAVDSANNPGTLIVSGGNGIGGAGAKGYGFGVQYVYAKNANVEARYYNLKPYDANKAGFGDYKPSYHLVTNIKF